MEKVSSNRENEQEEDGNQTAESEPGQNIEERSGDIRPPKRVLRKLGRIIHTLSLKKKRKATGTTSENNILSSKDEFRNLVSLREIFDANDDTEIENFQSKYLERIDTIDWREVLQYYTEIYNNDSLSNPSIDEKKLKIMNDALVEMISERLGIVPPPQVVLLTETRESKSDDEKGFMCGNYTCEDNSIVISLPNILKRARIIADSMNINKDNIQWVTIAFVEILSHELWHAFQNLGDAPEYRKELYHFNRKHYISFIMDPVGYKKQLIEKEAYIFERKVLEIIFNQMLKRHEQKVA